MTKKRILVLIILALAGFAAVAAYNYGNFVTNVLKTDIGASVPVTPGAVAFESIRTPADGVIKYNTPDFNVNIKTSVDGQIVLDSLNNEVFQNGFMTVVLDCRYITDNQPCDLNQYIPVLTVPDFTSTPPTLNGLFKLTGDSTDSILGTRTFTFSLDSASLNLENNINPNDLIVDLNFSRTTASGFSPINQNAQVTVKLDQFCLSTNLDNIYTSITLPEGSSQCPNAPLP